MHINNKYKDTLFRKIFGEDKNNALSLYNALNGTNYTNSDDLTITTIDDIIYMDMKNDTSYLIDGNLQLTEHQSTFNPNMPVRGFMYYGKLYDQYIVQCKGYIYGEKQIKLPNPKYYVLYNGDEKCPERTELKLSDAYIHPDNSGMYEWTAIMLNINADHNKELMKACTMLEQYSLFVAKVKTALKTNKPLDVAINETVDYCIKHNILKKYLLKNKAEVVDMVLTEYDKEQAMKALRNESMEKGLEEGRKEGRKEGHEKGLEEGAKGLVKALLSLNVSQDIIISQLIQQFGYTTQKAVEIFTTYKN